MMDRTQNFDVQIGLETFSVFFNTVRVSGWCRAKGGVVTDAIVQLNPDNQSLPCIKNVGFDCPHLLDSEGIGFAVQCLIPSKESAMTAHLLIEINHDEIHQFDLGQLVETKNSQDVCSRLASDFYQTINGDPTIQSIIDVGGRDRSRMNLPPGSDKSIVTFDIVDAPEVDVVGDAHLLSQYFPDKQFDAFVCVAVFEHLLMPWKGVLELNRILRCGALGLVHTHQTVGMHDLPWDFWRFSSDAWPALFNDRTGFEIVDAAMSMPQYIVPFHFEKRYLDSEKSAGFESSTVVVRKTGESGLAWEVDPEQIYPGSYPTDGDR